MTREIIKNLNEIAQINFARAKAMLDGINLVLGTKYGWLNKRVVWFENPNGSTAEKFAHAHDAYATAEREERKMQKRHAVTVMICDAQLARIAYEQGNIAKAAYFYGEFIGINQIISYDDIVECTSPDERKDMINTINNLTDVILEAISSQCKEVIS